MRLSKTFLFILISFVSLQICFGQDTEEIQPSENWLKEYNIYPEHFLFHRFDRYSKDDIFKFREKLDSLKNAKFDEWEGIYYSDIELLGFSQFQWKANVGFINFYVYTCLPELRYLNYGKVINLPGAIQLFPEFAENSPRMQTSYKLTKYVKVKWNDRHYLVEESSLVAFAEKAVGVYVKPSDGADKDHGKWANYWVSGDVEKPLTGLPEFPASYKKSERLPIETKITSVGKRTIEREKQGSRWFHSDEAAFYTITIGAGKNKGVKEGMLFNIAETDDQIIITKVEKNTAIGLISRDIDETKNDHCLDEDANKIVCPKIKADLKVKTIVGEFNW